MEQVMELEEALEAFPIDWESDYFAQELFKKKVTERKLPTPDIEKLSEYSSTELSSDFLKQLTIVKEIKNEKVEDFILMLNALATILNYRISDFDYDLELASAGDSVFYNGLLEDKEKGKEANEPKDFFSSAYFPVGYLNRVRSEALDEIRELEKNDYYEIETLYKELLEIMEEATTGSDTTLHHHEVEIGNIISAAQKRVDLHFAVLKEQRRIDLEIKIKGMEFL